MNRIFPEQLASNLNSHLAKVYFLVGTDPLLLSEGEDSHSSSCPSSRF